MDGVRKTGEVVRQQVGVGQPDHCRACGLRERASVGEVGIRKMCVPVEIVVDGVIDSAAIFAAIAEVERSDAEMIEEDCPVGAGAQCVNAQVSAVANFLPVFGGLGIGDGFQLVALPDRDLLLGIFNVASHAIDEFLQGMRSAHGQIAATVAVAIDISGGMPAKFIGMSFAPLGGTEQSGFLAIPHAVNDGALGLPSLLEQSGEAAGFFHQNDRA